MTDEERALEVMRGLAPMRVCYTDAGAAAEVINRIAAALAAERERCAEACKKVASRLTPLEHPEGDEVARLCAAAIRALGDSK